MFSLDTHILFTAIPAWGHIRPICILLAKLIKENDNLVATAIVSPNFLGKADSEIATELGGSLDENTRRRIRVLSTFLGTGSDSLFDLMGPTEDTYVGAYETLTMCKPILCATRGTIFEPVLAPTIVIMDFFALKQFRATRSVTGFKVPIVASIPAHASSMIRLFGPEAYGGMGDPTERILAEAARTGLSENEIGDKLLKEASGKIIKIAGLPDMYDWEYFAQQLPFEGQWPVTKGANVILKECDGVISVSSYAFESESIESMRSWFAEWRKELFVLGPLLPEGYGTRLQSSRGSPEIERFLDKMLLERGEKSVLFMSFGTVFWSTTPEYIEETLEALIEKNFPFIFTYASPFASLPQELLSKVERSGIGLLTNWSPQQYILSHPATGWFLSHCGHNSIMESLGCGVPLICWPFQADQPAAAAYLSERLNVAFELIEVRTGEKGLKPLLRSGRAPKGTRAAVGVEIRTVIGDCRGTKGEELRKNAEAFKSQFAAPWQKDGISRREAQSLLKICKT